MFRPKTLSEAYSLAKLQELTVRALGVKAKGNQNNMQSSSSYYSSSKPVSVTATNKVGIMNNWNGGNKENEVDYSTKEWKLDSEMEDEKYADEEIDLHAEIDVIEEEEADWDVQQTTATVEADSEHAPCPIGEICDNNKELYFLSSSLESKGYPKVEKSGKESEEIGSQNQRSFLQSRVRENAQMKELVFGEGIQLAVDAGAGEILDHGKVIGIELLVDLLDNKTLSQAQEIKETKRLPSARRNASLRELAVTLNAVTNLTRLPVQFPKPNVKMKLVAQLDDELYEGFDDHSNVFFGRGEFSNFDARVHSLIWWENGFKVVENQPDQMRGALWFLPGLFENVEEIVKGFDNLFEGVEGVGWFLASSYASSRNYRSLKRLSVRFPRPMVKMKPMKYVGKARPKSWRWVNFALRLTYKCLLIIAFDILVRMLRWIQERSVAHSLEARVPSFLEDKEALGGAVAYLCERKNKRSAVAYLCERKNKRSAAAYLCDSLRTRKIVTITKCRREVTG